MFSTGDVIADRWQLERLVGEGGLSQVWLVRHRELGNVLALKMLVVRRPKLADRLVLEGRIQAQLKHPNIVPVTDIVRHEGYVGLLMEYVEGAPLDAYLAAQGAMPLERALDLMASVIAAVATAHDAGVLHRDLKPANVLLARTSHGLIPKVTDFGIAKVLEGASDVSVTRAGSIMGTPGYLAPEQASNAADVDARADVFALAAIFYELVAGRSAFSTDIEDLFAYADPPVLDSLAPEVPAHIVQAVHEALVVDRAARTPDVRSFARALLAEHPELLAVVEGVRDSPPLRLTTLDPLPAASTPTLAPMADEDRAAPPSRLLGWLAVGLALVAALGVGLPIVLDRAEPPAAPTPAPARVEPIEPVVDALRAVRTPSPAPTEAPVVEAEASPAQPPTTTPTPPPVERAPTPGPTPTVTTTTAVKDPEPAGSAQDAAQAAAPPEPTSSEGSAEAEPEERGTTEPAPPPVPVRSPPDVRGLWRGDADGRPVRVRFTGQDGSRVDADVTFVLGPTERTLKCSGTVDLSGRLSLATADGELSITGDVTGGKLSATYQGAGIRKALPLSATWTSR